MKTEMFNKLFEEQVCACSATLIKKAKEYATEDRLHNFKVAAELQGITPQAALAGMMAKHTVSVYDLCNGPRMLLSHWEEKITDHINYLILLKAIVVERNLELADRNQDQAEMPATVVKGFKEKCFA